MVINLSAKNSLIVQWVNELRNIEVQQDRQRFRINLKRIGHIAAYAISEYLPFKPITIQTPLGIHPSACLETYPVLVTILRAGLPLYQGVLDYFDQSDSGFIGAYRDHSTPTAFEIQMDYTAVPNLNEKTVVLIDPMLATGASLLKSITYLKKNWELKKIFVVAAIASQQGIQKVQRAFGDAITIVTGAIDNELTDRGYILPGLGDAGDLAFGNKI